MTIPSLLIGLVISSLYAAVFHLLRGGGPGRLLLYILLTWIGFWGGHILGDFRSWHFLGLGPLNLGMATVGSIFTLAIGYWLSLVDTSE